MVISGHIENGVVVLEGGVTLPEGTHVTVVLQKPAPVSPDRPRRRVELPLVPSDHPGSVQLTAERIAEILDEDDASA